MRAWIRDNKERVRQTWLRNMTLERRESARIRTKKWALENRERMLATKKLYYERTKTLVGRPKGEEHHLWKGASVGYDALHGWVVRNKGNPRKCELCGTLQAKKYEWASKTHEYKRDLDEFFRACTSCHRKYDMKNNNYKVGFKMNEDTTRHLKQNSS